MRVEDELAEGQLLELAHDGRDNVDEASEDLADVLGVLASNLDANRIILTNRIKIGLK